MEKNYDEEMNEAFIREFIEEYFENPTLENAVMVLGQLTYRAVEGGMAPMPMMNVTTIVLGADPDAEMEDILAAIPGEEEQYVTVSNDFGRWIPLFTDRGELDGLEETNAVREVPILAILAAALNDPEIEGVIINPASEHFEIRRRELEWMLSEERINKFIKEIYGES